MHQIPIWLCADWILLAKIMMWIVMIWNFSELRTIWFLPNAWTWIVVVHSGSDHKLLHIQKPNNEHFEWFIFISILFLSSGRFSSRFFFVSFKRRDEDEKKNRWIFKSYAVRFCCILSSWPQPPWLSLLLFRSFIQFPFYDNKFFIFVWKWKPTFNNLFCLQWIWCEVLLALSFGRCSFFVALLLLVQF